MKSFFIAIASILLLSFIVKAEQEDSIFVIISGDTVHIWNTGVYENCGCLFRMDVSLSNDTIYVTEVDTTSGVAYCYCNFDLCASVTGLQTGNYFVKVFRYMPLFYPDTLFYIGSTSFTYSGSVLAFISQSYQSDCYNITDIEEVAISPREFGLDQNYPNPFNPSTTISWQSPVSSWQTLKVYDILGNEVATLVDEYKNAGGYEVEFNGHTDGGQNLSSGIYFYQLRVTSPETSSGQGIVLRKESFGQTKKMILLR